MASGRLVDYLGQGPIADRPATPDLTTGAVGLWFATDTAVLSAWDGTAWGDTGGGSSGTVESVVAGDGIGVDATDPANPVVSATNTAVVESVVAGDGVAVDATDPANPVVSATTTAVVESIVAGTNVTVDDTDPANPIVNASGGGEGFRGARVYIAEDTTISYPLIVSWDTVDFDTSGVWDDANPTRLTIPSGIDYASFFCSLNLTSNVNLHSILIQLYKNGSNTNVYGPQYRSSNTTGFTNNGNILASGPLHVVEGDYFEIRLNLEASGTYQILENAFSVQLF